MGNGGVALNGIVSIMHRQLYSQGKCQK